MTPQIALSGIMKNEALGVIRTLDAIRPIIDCVALLDTGSDDGTPEIVEAWMKKHDIPGVVVRGAWPGRYDTARNKGIEIARATGATWMFEIDCDWIFQGNGAELREHVLNENKAHGFQFEVQTPASMVRSVRMRRCDAPFVWNMGVHEELQWHGTEPYVAANVDGARFIYMNTTPESDRQARYLRDVEMLLPDAEKGHPRSQFFLGQTYMNMGEKDKAIEWYVKRGETVQGAVQERAIAYFRAGHLADKIEYFLTSFAIDPARAEPLWELAFRGVKGAAELAVKIPKPPQGQFVYEGYYRMAEGIPTNNAAEIEFRQKQLACLMDVKGVQ